MITGEIVRLCRRKRKLTMRALAEKAGVTAQMISNIEHGRCVPKVNTFLKIINAMDFDIEILDLHDDLR